MVTGCSSLPIATPARSPEPEFIARQLLKKSSTRPALNREDSNIDDHTFIGSVERGNFRLHPAGYKGVSNGCITFISKDGFNIFRAALLRTPTFKISGQLEAYGTVQVY